MIVVVLRRERDWVWARGFYRPALRSRWQRPPVPPSSREIKMPRLETPPPSCLAAAVNIVAATLNSRLMEPQKHRVFCRSALDLRQEPIVNCRVAAEGVTAT